MSIFDETDDAGNTDIVCGWRSHGLTSVCVMERSLWWVQWIVEGFGSLALYTSCYLSNPTFSLSVLNTVFPLLRFVCPYLSICPSSHLYLSLSIPYVSVLFADTFATLFSSVQRNIWEALERVNEVLFSVNNASNTDMIASCRRVFEVHESFAPHMPSGRWQTSTVAHYSFCVFIFLSFLFMSKHTAPFLNNSSLCERQAL